MTLRDYINSESVRTVYNLWRADFVSRFGWSPGSVDRLYSEYLDLAVYGNAIEEIRQDKDSGYYKNYINKYSGLSDKTAVKNFITNFIQSVRDYECLSPVFEPKRFFNNSVKPGLSTAGVGEKLGIAWERTEKVIGDKVKQTVNYITNVAGDGVGNLLKPITENPIIFVAIVGTVLIFVFTRIKK